MNALPPYGNGPIAITAQVAVSALGRGRAAHMQALAEGRSGLTPCDWPGVSFPCYVGAVAGLDGLRFPAACSTWDNRANRLALAALETDGFADQVMAVRERVGAHRLGVVIGTSTSGVEEAERAYRGRVSRDAPLPTGYSLRHHNDHHAVVGFLRAHLRLTGPGYTISTACSSSAKAISDAVQLVRAGLCDAVLAGGVDSLCLTSLFGFEALELVSREPCRPCDAARDGLSIGEGAAFLLVERCEGDLSLSGVGESSDGVHMSTPPEDGAGAVQAMRTALADAELETGDIGFVKLHGTATPANDKAEGKAVAAVFGTEVPAASIKGAVGHTLGAAGALEAVMCLDAMREERLPGNTGLRTQDPEIPCSIAATSERRAVRHLMTNAFGFGGSNSALIFSRLP